MRGILRKIFLAVAAIILFYVMGGWKIPVLWRIESLELPKGWKTVYQTKIWISDVYWFHIKGEKVIKCDIGYEAAKEYIEEHNSAEELKDIRIDPYGGTSDTAIYDSQFDEAFWQQPDRDDYITISYLKKWRLLRIKTV